MPWIYEQSTGRLYRPNEFQFLEGHAGRGAHLNNSASECMVNEGPIPRGDWTMTELYNRGPASNPRALNPMPITPNNSGINNKGYIIKLMPQANTNTCGRDGFLIHGGDLTSSQGCIIINTPSVRKSIWDSGDHDLRVVDVLENTP